MNNERLLKSARESICIQAESIKFLENQINSDFEALCKKILKIKGKLILMGVGKSGHIAEKISATLASTGTPSFFIHPTEAAHGDLGMIDKNDLILIFSNSGETNEIISILPALRKKIKSVCSITNSKNSSIAKASDIHIEIKILKEACPHNLAPTTSTTSFLVVGDALAISLLEAKNFSPEDFAKSHPAGSLGKKLTTLVSDLAITGKEVPIVKKNTPISEAIIEISSKKLGVTLVQDKKKIVGIFTDGDLRRFLSENTQLDKVKINDVMTKKYVSVDSKALAAEAAKLMEQNKIFTLIVKNNSGPSVITMHALLEAGIT